MSSRKYSLRRLFNRIRNPSNERAHVYQGGDERLVAVEETAAETNLSQEQANHIESSLSLDRDQASRSLNLDAISEVSDTANQHVSTVDSGSDNQQPTIQDSFGWLLRHNLSSRTSRVHAPIVEPEIIMDPQKATKQLRHNQYTVGWICALPKEMTAAKAMLDEVHMPLPNAPGDHNTYQLGMIAGHNIVIACLRNGVYGTTSATAVAIAMRSTYCNSNIMPLMVGIGGGVPDPHDIRLGDVVIGTPSSAQPAIVQYDYGRSTKQRDVETRGVLDKPTPALLSALSHFQSELALRHSKVSQHMNSAINRFSLDKLGFSYPGSERDILFEPECERFHEDSNCKRCPLRRRVRQPRQNLAPVLHYGTIGSGNQVIKHARTRDRIAERHDIFCFEMEAAGVMDYFPCLVIRGISDYCDTHKSKEWQEYASLAAAAVAKEFLSCTPPSLVEHADNEAGTNSRIAKRQLLLKSLDFEERYRRRDTVKRAHPLTCGWVFQQHEFLDWTNPEKYESHRGLIWMRGKPGAGKSTILKYLLEHTEKLCEHSKTVVVVSFFFNARGNELARSTIGLYRALVVQILEQMPALESILDQTRLHSSETSFESHKWTLEALEEILCDIVKLLGNMHLICYIDALDECPEDQIREMVSLFDQLAELADTNHLYVCLSSRHYPHISMKVGLDFILENQEGHSKDIISYLDSELRLGKTKLASDLREKMFTKSGGIFLWIVLVVQIINREYDRGGVHKLLNLLNDIPTKVDELFRDILTRDTFDLPELVTSIRWVLYSQRPLRLEEFYHAIQNFSNPYFAQDFFRGDMKVTHDDMQRYLLNCSKGLMETTASRDPTVHFIHETVREFLLQPAVLTDLWPGFEGIFEGESHDLLKECCYGHYEVYSKHVKQNKYRDFPFMPYAIQYVLNHAEQAERFGVSQGNFLERFEHNSNYKKWISDYNSSISSNLPRPSTPPPWTRFDDDSPSIVISGYSSSFGLYLAKSKLPKLLACWVERARTKPKWTRISTWLITDRVNAEDFEMLKTITLADRNSDTLTESVSNICDMLLISRGTWALSNHLDTGLETMEIMAVVNALRRGEYADLQDLNLALHVAASKLVPAGIELFLQFGAEVDSCGSDGLTVMHRILTEDHPNTQNKTSEQKINCIKMALSHGACVNVYDEQKLSPLSYVLRQRLYVIVDILLDHGAHVLPDDLILCLNWLIRTAEVDSASEVMSDHEAHEILSYHEAGQTDVVATMLRRYTNGEQEPVIEKLFRARAIQAHSNEAVVLNLS